MGLGKGKTEHSGPRDMAQKTGHWGDTDEAKAWATRARRRDEEEALRRELEAADADGPGDAESPPARSAAERARQSR